MRDDLTAAQEMFEALEYVVDWHREHDSGEGELFGLDYVTTCIAALAKAREAGMGYILEMSSQEYGLEEFPYESMKKAIEGRTRLQNEADKLKDGVMRTFHIRHKTEEDDSEVEEESSVKKPDSLLEALEEAVTELYSLAAEEVGSGRYSHLDAIIAEAKRATPTEEEPGIEILSEGEEFNGQNNCRHSCGAAGPR